MRNKFSQISLFDIYSDVSSAINNREPSFLDLLDEHLDLSSLIPVEFYRAFYKYTGRKRVYSLESFIRFFLLQKFIGIDKDSAMLITLSVCQELRDFCGFTKLPDAAKITRFKQDFCDHLENFFNRLVDITEPICRALDEKKADYLIFDTTGLEIPVAENNPKFFNIKLKHAKAIHKKNPNFDPYLGVYVCGILNLMHLAPC